jgi:hypothetical protein
MRVICVMSFDKIKSHPSYDGEPLPQVGSEYLIVDTYRGSLGLTYILAGFPDDCSYEAKAFATLPEATADEMQEAEREAILV